MHRGPRGRYVAGPVAAARQATRLRECAACVIKQAAFLCGCLLLAACSALLNSGRPKYEGAIVRPLWHDGGFDVTQTPIVRGGVVYAVGQSLGSGPSHIYAFDARTGRRRWIGRTAATRIIAVGDRTLLIGGAAGSLALLANTKVPRRYYIHINNTNPVLDTRGPEYKYVSDAGWQIGQEGWQLN